MTATLIEKYGMDAEARGQRKAFLGITQEDEQTVAQLRSLAEHFASQFAEGFYRHLLAHSATAQFLQDPELVTRLKQKQMEYFQELVSGDYGEEYFEKRLRVGEAHQKVGLEPNWYLGAYNQYIQLCFPYFAKATGGRVNRVLLSLMKIILLDIGLALETYFAEATEQLRRRNQELQEALQMYWQAELKAQQYAKLAGHEIRGSLNAIANACEVVGEDFGEHLPTEVQELLRSAQQRCWKTAEVVERILAEPEHAGKCDWVVTSELLEEVASRIEFYSSGKQVKLTLPTEPVRLWADPIGLREVFANLLSNAIQHLDKQAGHISIEYLGNDQEHVFCIADNGPGISPELQQRIFQPFVRGPGKEKAEGKGLGLHFVRAIVEQHRGRVWVESVPGTGSRFYFSLPKDPYQHPFRSS